MTVKTPAGRTSQNQLHQEKSPYLLQHADNPVDWYPWGPEAFEKARREDKPIFLSIGYSTCHWCHVMAHESFEDPEVARLMNEAFVSIKVDREERPDVDSLYMEICQRLTGSGGWPLTILMTPEKVPFFAGTYFPKENRYGRMGMLELVPYLREMWQNRREELLLSTQQVLDSLRHDAHATAGEQLDEGTLWLGYDQLSRRFDRTHGGFGGAPKFPTPHHLTFLLRYWKRSKEPAALAMVETTLQKMRLGGIYDHVGFGFHRYSTDARWFLPHFEKMLYDQALLGLAYAEAYQATRREEYARVVREIFTYVRRDLWSPEGGFLCAEDADSEGEEGKFYLWTKSEIMDLLGKEDGTLFSQLFGITGSGNYSEEAGGGRTGRNIPHLAKPLADSALEVHLGAEELQTRWEKAREKLFVAREMRVRPHRDDKVLTDWNGLMIAALAKGAQALGDSSFAEAAEKAAGFLLKTMLTDEGRLLHRYREGEAGIPGHLDDYAFLTWGLLELYETTFKERWLSTALDLSRTLLEHFWDDASGALYLTPDDGEQLLVRQKEIYDGAIPSGNSIAAQTLLRLGRMTGNVDWEGRAEKIGRAFSQEVTRAPAGCTQLLQAVDFGVGSSREVVIAGDSRKEDTATLVRAIHREFLPHKVLLLRPMEEDPPGIGKLVPSILGQRSLGGQATAYVCTNFACESPTTDLGQMLRTLGIETP